MSVAHYQGQVSAPEQNLPLVFAFHGTGGNEHQFFGLAKAMVPGAGIISPRGDVSEGGAARFFRRTSEGVYDMDDLRARTQRMAEYIAAHKASHPDRPMYGFGYSNGANILASVVFEQPDLFDRVGLLHPLIPWDPGDIPRMQGLRVLISAGQHDPITPWSKTQRLVSWFNSQGARVSTAIHEGGHELRQMEIDALQTLLTE